MNEFEFSEGFVFFVMFGEGKNEVVKDVVDINLLNGICIFLLLFN